MPTPGEYGPPTATIVRIADAVVGGLGVSRVAVVVLAAIAVLQTLLHLVSILASSRLR